MADVQNPATTPAPKRGNGGPAGTEAGREAAEAEPRVFDEGARQAKEGARAAEAVAEKTADATRAAAKANSEILRTQIETAQQAVHSGMEAGMRSVEELAQNVTRTFGIAALNPDLAEQSAQNLQAVSQASSALAKGAQEAARIWFDLSQKSLHANLEAMGRFASCRSIQEVVTLQSNLLRTNLKQAIDSGQALARVQSDAIQAATRVMQPAQQQPQPR